MDGSRSWDTFVNEFLLKSGAITGILLVSHQGTCLYSVGSLDAEKILVDNPFLGVFDEARRQKTNQLRIYVTGQGAITFQVHQKTNCSLYAASAGSHLGLLVGNLPHGILVCTYMHQEPQIGVARKQFEHACSLLRS